MATLLKHGGQHKPNGNFVMSTSFTLARTNSDYVDDGKFSSDDDCAAFPTPTPKPFILPPSASNSNLLRGSLIRTDLNANKNGKNHLIRKNSVPLYQVTRKNSIPPPLPPQKPKIKTTPTNPPQLPTTLATAIKNHSLVRSESAPSANLSNGFKIAKETLAAELNKIRSNDVSDRNVIPVQDVPIKKTDSSPASTKLDRPPPIPAMKVAIKKSPNHRSHSCANSSSNHHLPLNVVPKSSHIEDDLLEDLFWFHSSVTRQEAERKLIDLNKEGGYLIRYKSDPMPNVPYSLSVYKEKVYHLEIRQKQNGNFALGDFKNDELEFSCLQAMVNFYKRKPLQLVRRSSTQVSGCTQLTLTPSK